MSLQERRSLSNIIMSVIVSVVYFIIVYNKYQNGDFDTTNLMKFYSVVILWFIPISVGARIVLTIIFRIGGEIRKEITQSEEDLDIVDERDKLVELKGQRIALVIFSFGFISALFTQVFDMSLHAFFIALLLGGLVSDLVGSITEIFYYRRGV